MPSFRMINLRGYQVELQKGLSGDPLIVELRTTPAIAHPPFNLDVLQTNVLT